MIEEMPFPSRASLPCEKDARTASLARNSTGRTPGRISPALMPGPSARVSSPSRLNGAHTRHRLLFHLVWIPKYRKKVLLGEVATRLRGLIEGTARENGWPLIELNIQSDHVHALLQLDPATSVSRAMQSLKGSSSIRLRREFPEIRRAIWGKSLWADGFYATTVGATQEEVVRRYIREQPERDQSQP